MAMYTNLIHILHKIRSFRTIMYKTCNIGFIHWIPGCLTRENVELAMLKLPWKSLGNKAHPTNFFHSTVQTFWSHFCLVCAWNQMPEVGKSAREADEVSDCVRKVGRTGCGL